MRFFSFVVAFTFATSYTVFPKNTIQLAVSETQLVLITRFAEQIEIKRHEILKHLGKADSYYKGLALLRKAIDDSSYPTLKKPEVLDFLANADNKIAQSLLQSINDKNKALKILKSLDLEQFFVSRKVAQLEEQIQYVMNHLEKVRPKNLPLLLYVHYQDVVKSLSALKNELEEKRLLLNTEESILLVGDANQVKELLKYVAKRSRLLREIPTYLPNSIFDQEYELGTLLSSLSFKLE